MTKRTIVIEISGGVLYQVSADVPDGVRILLVDYDDIKEGGTAVEVPVFPLDRLDVSASKELRRAKL